MGGWEEDQTPPKTTRLLGQDHSSPQDGDTVSGGREDKITTQVKALHK